MPKIRLFCNESLEEKKEINTAANETNMKFVL